MPKKPEGGFIDFNQVDPAVAAFLADGEKRQANRTMTKAQKRQAARNRATFDLSEDLTTSLTETAAELSIPVSQLAEWYIRRGMEHTGMDELLGARLPARSMRYEFVLFRRDGDTKGHHQGSR